MCEVLSIDNNINNSTIIDDDNNNNSQESCKHDAFISNKCAMCNREDCNKNLTTIQFRYIYPDFSLTLEAIHHLRARNLETLLKNKKLHLVLDLDHTLLHSIMTSSRRFTLEDRERIKSSYEDVHEILDGTRLVKLRPGARDFLEQASAMFELSIYTMAKQCYAKEVAKVFRSKVCEKRVRFENVISKEDCSELGRKGLDVLLSDERVVLIVDDLEEVWGDEHRDNVIRIKPYHFFKKNSPWVDAFFEYDLELSRVLGVLKRVHNVFYENEGRNYGGRDVREVLERIKNESLVKE